MAEDFDNGQFIELIQQYPLIWNGKHADHRNKIKLENAWSTIAEIMGSTVEFCDQRWTTIRHRFAKERRLAQRPSGSASYTFTWPFYNTCSFLEDVVMSRKTVGNIKKPVVATATVVSSPQEQSRKLRDVSHDLLEDDTTQQDILMGVDESNSGSTLIVESEDTRSGSSSRLSMLRQQKTPKRKRQENESGAIAELSSTITSAFKDIKGITSNLEDPEKNNEDFAFAKTVVYMLNDVKGKKSRPY